MAGRKGQITIEYMILTGFIVLAIIVPSIFFLYSITNASVKGRISDQQVADLGNGLINDAKRMYYLGLYSNKVSTYTVPRNVKNMYIVEINDGSKLYYYLGIVVDDITTSRTYHFQSDIPLTSDALLPYVNNNYNGQLINECINLGYTCNFLNFGAESRLPGKRKYKIETVYDAGIVKSSIVPLLD